MMKEADLIFDMGPKAGIEGGEIVAIGNYSEIIKNKIFFNRKIFIR